MKSSERQVNQLIESGLLAEATEIDNSSVVVLKQASGEKVIANYYVVEMNSRVVAQELKELLAEKKVGSTFVWEASEGMSINCEILKVLENKSITNGE